MEVNCASHCNYKLYSDIKDGNYRTKSLWMGISNLVLMESDTVENESENDYLLKLKNDSILQNELAMIDGTPCVVLEELLELDSLNKRVEFHFIDFDPTKHQLTYDTIGHLIKVDGLDYYGTDGKIPLKELWKVDISIEGIAYELSR